MSAGAVAAQAAELAAAVAWIDHGWRDDAARLAGRPPPSGARDGPPTFGEVARLGTGLVERLTAAGRWDDAAGQARHLRAFFARDGAHLGPIAAPTFDGLLAAVLARDGDEVGDFTALVSELFP